jgi:hypothetical protein
MTERALWITALGLMLGASSAYADEALVLAPVRSYAMPGALSLAGATYGADGQGRTFVAGVAGSGLAQRCMVVVASDVGATAYAYQYSGAATRCAGAALLPDGGLLVRAVSDVLPESEAPGVTARIDAAGQVVWEVADRVLVDAKPSGEGGTGAFVGAWAGPHPALAYSQAHGRVLGFTFGQLLIGQVGRALVQAHSVGGERGEVLVSGQTFGASGIGTLEALLVSADEVQDFLVQVSDEQRRGATFYRYDGRRRMRIVRPLGQSWEGREVRPMARVGRDLGILWRPGGGDAGDWRVTRVDEAGALVWEQALGTRPEESGLGEPLGIWCGESLIVLVYLRGEGPVVTVLDAGTGKVRVAEQALDALTARTPLTILRGADGALWLMSLDTRAERLHEDRLEVVERSEEQGDMGADMGVEVDMGPVLEQEFEDGCGCGVSGASGVWAPSGLVALGWMLAAGRRRKSLRG